MAADFNESLKDAEVVYPKAELEAYDFENFMHWIIENGGFNDLYIMTGYQVYARIKGDIKILVPASLTNYAVEKISQIVSENDMIMSVIVSGEQHDGIYVVHDRKLRGVSHRFRVNIKGIRALHGGTGVAITIRQISVQAPSIEQLGVEQEIIDAFTPRNGIVIVSGPTGSGKSTLFASLLGNFAEKLGRNIIIGTLEQPIEYVFDHIDMKSVVIYQSSVAKIGGDINSFDAGVRASLRSGTDGTVVGELRDLETIRAALTASNTGQTVWGTLHVNSVADMPSRVINVFPTEEMNKVRVEFYSNIRFLMCQILVPCIKPGRARVPVKEWLKLTADMRRQLIKAPLDQEQALLEQFVESHGMPMKRYAENLLKDGFIDEQTYQYICDGE
jgi:defect-in-organelle-trafficking protein DotB